MAYFLDLFSPETYEAFGKSNRNVSGFRVRQRKVAERVRPGDKLVCYMTKLSRWVGLLEVLDGPFLDDSPVFYPASDPFVVRFHVRPEVWLSVEKSIPIHDEAVWNRLSFTVGQQRNSPTWTGRLRGSLVRLEDHDGQFLEKSLKSQLLGERTYPVDPDEYRKMSTHRVRGVDKDISVSVPVDQEEDLVEAATPITAIRESTRIQALLAEIGSRMGMTIWIPRADRSRVLAEWTGDHSPPLESLPLNYDDTTLRTIEQIDVLWLRGRAIRRAFEVEHTTSIYSGILRMADLLALQPNMEIRLYLVAPMSRREKVFQELRRPVFSLLDRGPLSEICTYLSYESVRDLSAEQHLSHLADSVLDEYEEEAEE